MLGEFDVKYLPRPAIKAQALANFLLECTVHEAKHDPRAHPKPPVEEGEENWALHMDGSSSIVGFGGGLVLSSPDGIVAEHVKFKVSNNEAKYEVL